MHRLLGLHRCLRYGDGQDELSARADLLFDRKRRRKHWDAAAICQHMLRPRILIYFCRAGVAGCGLLVSLALRNPLKVDVIRDRQVLRPRGGRALH